MKEISIEGEAYLCLNAAARHLRVAPSALTAWTLDPAIARSLQLELLSDPSTGRVLISEQSVNKLAVQLENVPRGKPWVRTQKRIINDAAYYPISAAARLLSVSGETMFQWAHQGTATLGKGVRVPRFELKITRDERNRIYIAEDSLLAVKQLRSEKRSSMGPPINHAKPLTKLDPSVRNTRYNRKL